MHSYCFAQQIYFWRCSRCCRVLLKGPLVNEDALLPAQMFPRLSARATFVADTNFVSGTEKMFLILFRNILCPQPKKHHGQQCVRNNVSLFTRALRLPCTFRSVIFFKSGFLSQNIGRCVIFNFSKKFLKKTKFWRRNCSFTFTPEVKVCPLIDSPMMLCNQPRRRSRD